MRGTLQHVQDKHLLCTMYIVQRTMSLQDVLVDYTEYITHTVSTVNIYGRIKKNWPSKHKYRYNSPIKNHYELIKI